MSSSGAAFHAPMFKPGRIKEGDAVEVASRNFFITAGSGSRVAIVAPFNLPHAKCLQEITPPLTRCSELVAVMTF